MKSNSSVSVVTLNTTFRLILVILAVLKPMYSLFMIIEWYSTPNEIAFIITAVAEYVLTILVFFKLSRLISVRMKQLVIWYAISEGIYRIYLFSGLYLVEFLYWDMGWFVFQAPSVILLGLILNHIAQEPNGKNFSKYWISIHNEWKKILEITGLITIIGGIFMLATPVLPFIAFWSYLLYLTLFTILLSIFFVAFVADSFSEGRRDLIDQSRA